jgi:hypothetical protein
MPADNPNIKSFYLLPEWVTLMERWTAAKAHRLELQGEHGGQFTAVVYRTRGRLAQPRYMPYLGCEFMPTSSEHSHKITLQWLDLAGQFIEQLRQLGWNRWLTLPPGLVDMRPFTWRNILPTPRYTYCLEPSAIGERDAWSRRIKRSIKSAQQDGYTVQRNLDLNAAYSNIKSTEQRQQFEYSVTMKMLEEASASLGPEAFRLYNAYDQHNHPACSIIVLHRPGAVVQDWLAGTAQEHLKSGVTQLVRDFLFADLKLLGSRGFDFCGANLPAVAAAKSEFGGALTPFYQLEPLNTRYVTKCALRLLRKA